MNVAIMGAGLSGLSCALTLCMNGVTPTIFESRSKVGDRFINSEAMFNIFNRPIKDCLPYLSQKYNINLEPISEVNKLFIHSKNSISSVDGKIGYTNIRGRHEDSYENQLYKQLNCNINFNSTYSYEDLCKNFEYVVLATGDAEYASHLGNYKCDLTCTLKGVTIEGSFIKDNPHVWFNYDVIPKGYGWLIPYSEKESNLVMAYPDYPNNIKLDINEMWKKFYDMACKDLDQNFKVTDSFEVTRYMMGICNSPKIENTYFVGNCFGTISPGLGFGQYTSLLTGIYAAHDICKIASYKKLSIPLFENYNHSLILRRFLENLTDEQLDSHIKNLDSKFLGSIFDKLCSDTSSNEILKVLTPAMRIINNYNDSKD